MKGKWSEYWLLPYALSLYGDEFGFAHLLSVVATTFDVLFDNQIPPGVYDCF